MPMVKNGELDGNYIASSSLDSSSRLLDFGTKVKRPRRIGPCGVKDSRNVVFQHHGSEEANVDVSRELEDVLVLPAMTFAHVR